MSWATGGSTCCTTRARCDSRPGSCSSPGSWSPAFPSGSRRPTLPRRATPPRRKRRRIRTVHELWDAENVSIQPPAAETDLGPIVTLPRSAGGLSRSRRWAGVLVAGLGLPLLTVALVSVRSSLVAQSMLMIYLLAVVVVAAIGGVVAALLAAVTTFLLVSWFLTPPYNTLTVENRNAAIDLFVFVVAAVVVSVTVELGARNRESAERTRMESRLITKLSSAEFSGASLVAVLEQVRGLFGMSTVALVNPAREGSPLALLGPPPSERPSLTVVTTDGLQVVAYGPEIFAEDRRLLNILAAMASRAWQGQQLAEQSAQARPHRDRPGSLRPAGCGQPRPAHAAGWD